MDGIRGRWGLGTKGTHFPKYPVGYILAITNSHKSRYFDLDFQEQQKDMQFPKFLVIEQPDQ